MQNDQKSNFNQTVGNPLLSSPYLNFDPRILNPTGGSQFLIPEGHEEHRGKMEMSFLKIGTAVAGGWAVGGLAGLIRSRGELKQYSGWVKTSHLMNFVGRQGSTTAQSFGSIVLMFSLYDTIFSYSIKRDDWVNSMLAGAATGATFTLSRGLPKMGLGALAGLAFSGIYIGISQRETLLNFLPMSR